VREEVIASRKHLEIPRRGERKALQSLGQLTISTDARRKYSTHPSITTRLNVAILDHVDWSMLCGYAYLNRSRSGIPNS